MAPAGKPSEDTMEDRHEHTPDENEIERGDEPTEERAADETVAQGPDEPAAAEPGDPGAGEEEPTKDEQPVAAEEEAAAGEPVDDEPAAEEPTADEVTAEQPSDDEPAGEPTAEQPSDAEPTAEESAAEEPAASGATPDETTAEQATPAEPATVEASAGDPTAEQPRTTGGPEDPRGPQAPPTEPATQPLGAGGAGTGGPTGGGPTAGPPPKRLLRARSDRVLGGVCAGLGRYFNTDPVFFRIGAIVLTLIGGAGLLLYLAALLLIPQEDPSGAMAVDGGSVDGRSRGLVIAGVVILLLVAWPFLLGGGIIAGGILIPLAFLVATGVVVWWLVSGEGPSGDAKDIARRAALGIGLLVLCCLVAFGGAWAAAAGGEAIVAALVIAAGIAIVAGAFLKPVRWLILPALALGLSAGAVSAAGIDLDGGVGDRTYRPTSTVDLRDRYELGMGELTVDLSETDLPGGDTPLELDLGVGAARLIVPDDVCVATRAELGAGYAGVFDADSDGIDVDYEELDNAPAGTSRLVVDAQIGVGELLIGHSTSDFGTYEAGLDRDFDHVDRGADRGINSACEPTG
jgi:phage shock protein PspC (stress-responsive transcriptional regulator)